MTSETRKKDEQTPSEENRDGGHDTHDTHDERPLIVGIGASAGGLEAFKAFFSSLPDNEEMAYVLVQHLAPDQNSMLSDLLGRVAGIPVVQAEDGMAVKARHVYVIPPNATLTLADDVLKVSTPAPPRESRRPINSFFVSLAHARGERAACVVLSGTGSDGASGLKTVKDRGGLTLAEAHHDHVAKSGMPSSAVATGLVDDVLPVAKMPQRLLDFARHVRSVDDSESDGEPDETQADQLRTICRLLHAEVGHDFSQYKTKTLMRRIQRRMLVVQVRSLSDYAGYLRQHVSEYKVLFREFLIGVTEFFRDPEAMQALREKAIPTLLEGTSAADTLRVWVPACATGEEAFSIAILLCEAMPDKRAPKVRIFATDIDDQAIKRARSGRFQTPLTGVSDERIKRWFYKDGEDYCITKQVREMCIFSVHSVTRDPPFSRMDLVSCRNLLIYMGNEVQKRLVLSLHYALRPGGYLLLGTAERLGQSASLFTEVDKKQRLYRRRDDKHAKPQDFYLGQRSRPADDGADHARRRELEDLVDRHARQVLEPYSPAYVVVNATHEVVRFGGDTGRYLAPASGAASLNVFRLLVKPLRGAGRSALLQAFASGQRVIREGLTQEVNGQERPLRLIVEPLTDANGDVEMCVLAFSQLHYTPRREGEAAAPIDDAAAAQRIESLEDELRATRAQLHAAVDLHETANEDLKSANEEYQSVNEELQSANEELETTTEEMQSVNEELQTVNAELNSKNQALAESNSDLRNLLDSTHIATMFLDRSLHIRNYTPAMKELFNLREGDRGRPVTDISPRVAYPDLTDDVQRVLKQMSVTERLLHDEEKARVYLMRVRPYVTVEDVVDGVVLTFVDITESQELNREHARLAAIVNSSHDAIVGFSLDDCITSWNPGAEHLFGLSAERMIGRGLDALAPEPPGAVRDFFTSPARERRRNEFEMRWTCPDGGEVSLEMSYAPVRDDAGEIIAGELIARDVSERKRAELHTEMMLRELNHRVKNTLTSVLAIAEQTLSSAADLEAFQETFTSRLMALSRTHNLLARDAWHGITLEALIEAELAPYEHGDDEQRYSTRGARVTLTPKQSLALSMALHELATNAGKYGALSVAGGTVAVQWTRRKVADQTHLQLRWTESGGPPVKTPQRKGFGTRLISESLAYELDGQVDLEYPPGGVTCRIDVPLT